MEKEPKVGLSVLEWIICIVGIIVLSSFIVLPPVFRTFVKEKEEEPPVVITPIQTSCSKTVESESITMEYVYFLDGSGENLNMISYTSTGTYANIPLEAEGTCNVNNLNYQNIEGLYYNCRISENKVITESRVTFPNYQGETLPFMINFKREYSLIISNLTQNGFACNEVK